MFAMGSLLMFTIHASELPDANNPKLHEPLLRENYWLRLRRPEKRTSGSSFGKTALAVSAKNHRNAEQS